MTAARGIQTSGNYICGRNAVPGTGWVSAIRGDAAPQKAMRWIANHVRNESSRTHAERLRCFLKGERSAVGQKVLNKRLTSIREFAILGRKFVDRDS